MLYVHESYNKTSRSLLATHGKMYTSKSTSNYGCIKLTGNCLNYFNYSSRLVLTRKLVEIGSHVDNN
jgi:hypothetical protein